jgi:hypothetical protein
MMVLEIVDQRGEQRVKKARTFLCGLKDPWTWTLGKGKDGTSEKQMYLIAYKGS